LAPMGASIDYLPMTPQAIWSAVEKVKQVQV